jgi:hypothetical protein
MNGKWRGRDGFEDNEAKIIVGRKGMDVFARTVNAPNFWP